jgi:hypothetical protein
VVRKPARNPDNVYVMSNGTWSKIGIAVDVGKRWKSVRRCVFAPGCMPVVSWNFGEDAPRVEKAAHAMFEGLECNGEWAMISASHARKLVEQAAKKVGVKISKMERHGGHKLLKE